MFSERAIKVTPTTCARRKFRTEFTNRKGQGGRKNGRGVRGQEIRDGAEEARGQVGCFTTARNLEVRLRVRDEPRVAAAENSRREKTSPYDKTNLNGLTGLRLDRVMLRGLGLTRRR